MRRRPGIEPRRVIFIGVEGKSDRAFVQFLQRWCDARGLHVHLNVSQGSGGDSVAVVQEAGRRLKRHPGQRGIKHRLVLVDSDRIEEDRRANRDAFEEARRWGLQIILQQPNLEGLLLRLHAGQEQRSIRPDDAMTELRKQWPDYAKGSLSADRLRRRFSLSDVQRAAVQDDQLRKLLEILGL